jgi:tetratricopeptide (TPR) repeat protein
MCGYLLVKRDLDFVYEIGGGLVGHVDAEHAGGEASNARIEPVLNTARVAFEIADCLEQSIELGCASTKPNIDDPTTPTKGVSPKDARQIVAEFTARMGGNVASQLPNPSSVSEVVEIFKKDDYDKFEAAVQYLADLQGIDALALRAAIEAYWAGMQIGMADLLLEAIQRKDVELSHLQTKTEQGIALSPREKARQGLLKEQQKELSRVSDALRVLSKGHIDSSKLLSEEAIRQFPDKPEGYRAMAHAHQLKGEWKEYDRQLAKAVALLGSADDYGIMYLRAMEAAKRNVSKEEARALLEKLRESKPDFIRVQAVLVLVQDNLEATYNELMKLKSLFPNHPLVVLAGPTITKDYLSAAEIRDAMSSSTANSE